MGLIGLGVGYIIGPSIKPPIVIIKPNSSDILIAFNSTSGVESWSLEFNSGIREKNKYNLRITKDNVTIYFYNRNLSDLFNDLYSIKDIE
jgi:outer membrane protein assembly factor BamB